MQDWPTLEAAVEQKMKGQPEFVWWWDENVWRPGEDRKIHSGRPGRIKGAEAIDLTGITESQVSKWRRRLQEPEKFRSMLFGAASAKTIVCPNGP